MCISTQQLGRDWDTSYSSGIWDRKNDLTIGNGMIKKDRQWEVGREKECQSRERERDGKRVGR